jgi:hypothetical protein
LAARLESTSPLVPCRHSGEGPTAVRNKSAGRRRKRCCTTAAWSLPATSTPDLHSPCRHSREAGGAFRQTNVWSYIDGDAPAAGVTAGRIAGTVAPGRRARIYSGQQWAKAGIALQPHSKTTCRPRLPLALHAGQSDVLLTPAKRACQPFASPPPAAPGECRQGPRSRIRQRPVRHRQVTGLTRQIGTKLAAVNAGRPFRCAQPGNAANSPGTCLLDRADKPPPGVIRGGRPHTAPGLRVHLRVAPGAKPPSLPAQRGWGSRQLPNPKRRRHHCYTERDMEPRGDIRHAAAQD